MRWGFRIATGIESGSGHSARCRALAEALPLSVAIFSDPDSTHLDWPADLLESVASEDRPDSVDKLSAECRSGQVEAVLIDSYAIPDKTIEIFANKNFTAVFRDSAQLGPESLSIDINPLGQDGLGIVGGLDYAPLPSRFAPLHEQALTVGPAESDICRVLVSFGQRDTTNRTGLALQSIARLDQPLTTTVIMGAQATHLDEIGNEVERLSWAELRVAPGDLDDVYVDHDFALGAPGVSQLERACCGLPTILIAQTDKQEALAAKWVEHGAALYASPDSRILADTISNCLDDPEQLARVRNRGLGLVDGRGADRLAKALQSRAGAKAK